VMSLKESANAPVVIEEVESLPARPDGTPVKVRIRGLRKDFQVRGEPVAALEEVDLDIRDGEFFVIVGPSGCGKTTLLRILAGLETATAGRITMSRPPVTTGRPQPANAMVFQEHANFPWKTVRQNVEFTLKAQGYSRRERRETSDRIIDTIGLSRFASAYPHQLSGGMRQRVSIGRALAADPEMLLMDEPFAALDEQTKLVLQSELLRVWQATEKTVLYVTHSIDEAIVLGDRIMVMSARPGRILSIIDVDALFPRPRTLESVKSSPLYGELFGRVWSLLRGEVGAAQGAAR